LVERFNTLLKTKQRFLKPKTMIHFSIKPKPIVWIGLVLAVFVFISFKQCNSSIQVTPQESKITIVRDTVWQTKIDTFKVQTTHYKTVYVSKKDTSIYKTTSRPKDTAIYTQAKLYKDTLRNNDIEIYSTNLIDGHILNSEIAYKLKIPREITITKTIEHPKTYKSGLYVFSEAGGNAQQFDNLSLGLQYNRKGNWFVSYRLNVNPKETLTHNVGVGLRLF
jgi:hypothetical protein